MIMAVTPKVVAIRAARAVRSKGDCGAAQETPGQRNNQ